MRRRERALLRAHGISPPRFATCTLASRRKPAYLIGKRAHAMPGSRTVSCCDSYTKDYLPGLGTYDYSRNRPKVQRVDYFSLSAWSYSTKAAPTTLTRSRTSVVSRHFHMADSVWLQSALTNRYLADEFSRHSSLTGCRLVASLTGCRSARLLTDSVDRSDS